MELDIRKLYKPLPSQKYLHESGKQYKAYFGGFGSGKTNWLIWEIIFQLCKPDNYFIIMRRTYPELEDTLMKDFFDTCPPELIKEGGPKKRNVTFHSGSIGAFRSFDALGKIFSYNLGGFAIDQAEELPEDFFLALVSRLRRKDVPLRHGLLSLNPAGKNWVWRRFVKDNPLKNDPLHDYVIAKTDENIHLPDGYVDNLRAMFPPQWIARYVDCKFDEFSGLVYDNFKDINILKKLPIKPEDAKYIIVTIDIGINNPSGVLFSMFDEQTKTVIIFDEIYENNLTIGPICSLIKSRLYKWKIKKVWKYLADPDILKRQITSGRSSIQDFWTNGISVQPANNNKDYGILIANEMLGKSKTGEDAQIFVLDTLQNFLAEVFEYMYKAVRNPMLEENSPTKPQTKKDHLMGCLRYLVLGLPIAWTNLNAGATSDIYKKHFAKRFSKIKRQKPLNRSVNRLKRRAVSRWQNKNK